MGKNSINLLKALPYDVKLCYYALNYGKPIHSTQMRKITVSPEHITCFVESSNNIKVITDVESGDELFFRESRRHTELNEYIGLAVSAYAKIIKENRNSSDIISQETPHTALPPELADMFEKYIDGVVNNKKRLKALSLADRVLYIYGFKYWEKGSCITDEMLRGCGLDECPDALRAYIPHFLQYIKTYTYSYRLNRLVGLGEFEDYNAKRSIATKIIADAVGLSDLIPHTEYVAICLPDNTMERGVVCTKSPGTRAMDSGAKPSPQLQRNLTDLNVLDVLCYQQDHFTNNYTVSVENDVAIGVSAFDNDNTKAFIKSANIGFSSVRKGAPFVSKNGMVNRPHLSRDTANKLYSLDLCKLSELLDGYLSRGQISAVCKRTEKLIAAIKKTADAKADFLLDNDGWSTATEAEELSGAYGNTYFKLFCDNRP